MATRFNFPASKERRREEAKARQAEYNKLTTEQKLAKLGETGSDKQRLKLLVQLQKEKTNAVNKNVSSKPATKSEKTAPRSSTPKVR